MQPLHKLAGMLRFMILNDSLDTSKPRKLNRSTTTTTRSFWGTIKVALARLLPSPMNTNSVQEVLLVYEYPPPLDLHVRSEERAFSGISANFFSVRVRML